MTEVASQAVSYQVERLTDALWAELMPLLERHRAEVAHYPQDELAPQLDMYAKLDAAGGLRVYTARDTELALVGYLAFFVGPNPHYRATRMAACDVLYVAPEHRRCGTGYSLLRFARARLEDDGVHCIAMRTKARSDLNFGRLLTHLGYERVDEVWMLRIGDPPTRTP